MSQPYTNGLVFDFDDSDEMRKKVLGNSLGKKIFKMNDEFDKIINGKCTLTFFEYNGNVSKPKKQTVNLDYSESPVTLSKAIVLSGEASIAFRKELAKLKPGEDPYFIALMIYNKPAFKGKSAFFADSKEQIQEMLITLKCHDIEAGLRESLDREKNKLTELCANKQDDMGNSLFANYKREKIADIENKLETRYYSINSLKASSEPLLESLKNACIKHLESKRDSRSLYLAAAQGFNPAMLEKFPDKNKRILSKLDNWSQKSNSFDTMKNELTLSKDH